MYMASMYVLRPRSLNQVSVISEFWIDRSKYRERETETETEIDQSYLSRSERDSEQGYLIRLQTEVLP